MAAALLFVGTAVAVGVLWGRFDRPRLQPEANATTATHPPATQSTPVHPLFTLTVAEFAEIVKPAVAEARARILDDPADFLALAAALLDEPQDFLILVDKQHPLHPDYEPRDLVSLNRYRDRLTLNRNDLSLREAIMPALLSMVAEAAAAGVTLDISSTYRSYAYQAALFERHAARLGVAQAERESARAGTSQHQLGTAIDFGSITPAFAATPAGRWLAEHAHRWGFSLSYPDGYEAITGYIYESWHYRYITRAGTALERRFFGGIQQHLLEFWAVAGPRLAAHRQ